MSSCQDLEPLLAAYVDGDAAGEARRSIDAHIDRCPPCRVRVEQERTARQALVMERPRLRGCASARLRARCSAHAGASARRGTPMIFSRRVWVPLSLAATVMLAVAGVFLLGLNDPVEALATQLTLDHTKCFQMPPPTGAGANPESMDHDWNREQGWSLHVSEGSDAAQLQLLGVRRCLVSEGRTAHVMYRWRGQPLSVFILPRALQSGPASKPIVDRFGHESIVWTDHGRTYVIVVRGHPSGMEPLVGYLKANTQ